MLGSRCLRVSGNVGGHFGDRRIHVALDLRLSQCLVVDADVVDEAGEVLPEDAVPANL